MPISRRSALSRRGVGSNALPSNSDPETEQLLMEMNRIGLWFDIATHGVATRDAARAPTRSVRAAFQIVLKRRPDFLSMASGRVQVVRRQPGFA